MSDMIHYHHMLCSQLRLAGCIRFPVSCHSGTHGLRYMVYLLPVILYVFPPWPYYATSHGNYNTCFQFNVQPQCDSYFQFCDMQIKPGEFWDTRHGLVLWRNKTVYFYYTIKAMTVLWLKKMIKSMTPIWVEWSKNPDPSSKFFLSAQSHAPALLNS